jgi:hypothetical protein
MIARLTAAWLKPVTLAILICYRSALAARVRCRKQQQDSAAFLPAIGDTILDSGVTQGLSRTDPANRRMWTVVQRVLNPRDNEDCVVIVVEERQPLAIEASLLPQE